MNTSKCFQSLTRKYLCFSPRIYFTRCIYSKYCIRPGAYLDLPIQSLLVEPTNGVFSHIHPNVSIFKHYSSEPSMAEKCPTVHSNMSPLKFEEMSFEPPVLHEELMATLQKCSNLSEQMETLASTMALTSKDIENRKKFCKTLESLFKPFFNKVKIQMFGSSVNYFGFKGCDIDMTFETSVGPIEKIPFLDRPDIPLVSEVISGKVSPQEISQLPFREQLIFMHTVLLEYYKESSEPSIFINAHVPLVRFYHDKFNLKCDLTFKNEVAYANTKLLYFYAKLDERVIPLIMTIRYWAKHVELIGKGLLFNTYTITLLVIHFLQTRNPPVLPSAESILSLSDSFETEDMDDNSFLNIIENLPPSTNSQPIDELLREFFFYYLYFDFSRVVVPLIGTSIPRKEFIPKKDPKFIMNILSVQDPLCTFNNTASLLEIPVFKKFYSECVVICKMFQDNDVLISSKDPWGFMTFLHKPETYNFPKMDIIKPISFILPVASKSTDDKTFLKTQASLTAKTVLKVLEHALLFECSHLEVDKVLGMLESQDKLINDKKKQLFSDKQFQEEFAKLRRKNFNSKSRSETEIQNLPSETIVEQFRKVSSQHELILCCKCKISKDVFKGREFVKLNPLNLTSDLLNQEHLISSEIVKQNRQNSADQKKKSYVYLFECYVSSNADKPSILVNLRPLPEKIGTDYGYRIQCIRLSIFLKDYIPKIMKKIEL